ncbi:hypothetical protein AMTRI_Chr03g47270 [Amborella trichopoda]
MKVHYVPNALCSLSSLLLLLLLLLLFISFIPTSIAQPPQVLVWPKPRNLKWAPPYSSIFLSPTFTISYSGSNPYLQNAVSHYLRLILAEKYTPVRPVPSNLTASTLPLQTLTLSIKDEIAPLQHGVDESYLLFNTVVSHSVGSNAWLPVALKIWDAPLFEHRGVMLDTARNYYGVREILRTLGAMSENKLNLAEKGSYGAGMRYSAEEVRGIVEFGMSRGVRVVPEIDSPGKPSSPLWPGKRPLALQRGTGHLNLTPILSLAKFFATFLHSSSTPSSMLEMTRSFLSLRTNFGQLLETHINATHPYIEPLNRTAVYFQDVLLRSAINVKPELLPKETTILQSWSNRPNNTKFITSLGYRAIVSSSAFYYLDLAMTRDYEGNGGSWCGPFKTWQRIYDYDITNGLTTEEAKLVLVLNARLSPRTAAFAEAMWSGNRDEEVCRGHDRLNEWRYRMMARGVRAEPIQPLWCLKHPGMRNLNQ